jgi:hypothetical protein
LEQQLRTDDAQATAIEFDVYGLRAGVAGAWPEVIDAVRRDFAWFQAVPGTPQVSITVERQAPQLDGYGEVVASFVTPRNVVYQAGERTIVDYFGRAVSVLDRERDTLLVQGEDEHLVHEATYHYLLSRVGEHLDALGLPRLHALALSSEAGCVALMLPSGGGKSTMALRALEADGVRLLAEDSPLLDRHGVLHPFPLRIGVNASDAERLGDQHVRRLERMEFHPKLLLDLEAFADSIEPDPQPLRHLVVGRRSLGVEARLRPMPRSNAAGPLLREAVVGVGLYQGMEFVLQRGMRDVVRKAGVAAMRARCCAVAARRAQVWELTLGRDHERNWSTLEPLLSQ